MMQATRRGFLGIFGAGAIAGPRLAASIARDVTNNMPMAPSSSYGGIANAKIDDSWRLTQIAKLKKIIRGKDPLAAQRDKMHRGYMADNCERVRLDSLRSVSPGHKMRMLVDSAHARSERIRRADAGFSLAQMLNGED